MTFSKALEAIKGGQKMMRQAWIGIVNYIVLQIPEEGSVLTNPYIDMYLPDGRIIMWMPHQDDVLAEDWIEVSEPKEAEVEKDLVDAASENLEVPEVELEVAPTADMEKTATTVECGIGVSEQACELGETDSVNPSQTVA